MASVSAVPVALFTAVAIQVLCQIFKFLFYSIRDGRISPHYLVSAGGIPSAHSAFVTALTTGVGLRVGFGSELFSVSAVFSLIVIYDAFRLRGHVQRHAERLNSLQRTFGHDAAPLSEMVGHSIPELTIGIILGAGFAVLSWFLFGG